ncbi:MAG: hypothetical protein KA007_00555 [Candidatus Pacebacteria bacterium]|nr:hypothetical protein [Candidatus Paceibacterota bacterium]
MQHKIINVKNWTYINNTFIKPLTEIREMLLENKFTADEHQFILMKMNNVSDSINEVLFKMEKKLSLAKESDEYELEDFFSKNSVGLDITKNLFVKEQPHSLELIKFFNYLTENVDKYLNTYLKLHP